MECLGQVTPKTSGLDTSEDRDTAGFHVDRSTPDAIHGVTGVPIRRGEEETAVAFTAKLVERRQPSRQFVANQENTRGIVAHDFVKLLKCGVLRDQARANWRSNGSVRT